MTIADMVETWLHGNSFIKERQAKCGCQIILLPTSHFEDKRLHLMTRGPKCDFKAGDGDAVIASIELYQGSKFRSPPLMRVKFANPDAFIILDKSIICYKK